MLCFMYDLVIEPRLPGLEEFACVSAGRPARQQPVAPVKSLNNIDCFFGAAAELIKRAERRLLIRLVNTQI